MDQAAVNRLFTEDQERSIVDRVEELDEALHAERAKSEDEGPSVDEEDGPHNDVEPMDDVAYNASSEILGGVLRSLMNRDEVDTRLVASRFEEINESLSWLEPGIGGKSDIRRTCVGCGGEFSDEDNRKGACTYYRWHPKEAKLDTGKHRVWDNYEIDEDVGYDEYDELPAGYTLNCCGQDGDKPGCSRFQHIAKQADNPELAVGAKRRRVE